MKPSGMNKLFPLTLFLLLAFSSSSCSPQPYDYLHFGFYRDEAAESALRLAAVMNRAVEAKEGDDEFSFRVFLGFGADYLAYPDSAPSLSSYGIAEVAFERLFLDSGLEEGASYVELQRMSAAVFEKVPVFLANGEDIRPKVSIGDFDGLFFPFTRIDILTLPKEGSGRGFLAYRLHAYDKEGQTVDSPIIQEPLAFSFAYDEGTAEFALVDSSTLDEKEQSRELPYDGWFWPEDYLS